MEGEAAYRFREVWQRKWKTASIVGAVSYRKTVVASYDKHAGKQPSHYIGIFHFYSITKLTVIVVYIVGCVHSTVVSLYSFINCKAVNQVCVIKNSWTVSV
jgi:hypothetical protein